MATNPKIDCGSFGVALCANRTPAHWVQLGFYATSIIFNLCLIAQVLTVGVAYFTDPTWWKVHVWLVRGYSGLSLILLGGSLIAPFSNRIRALAASLPVLLGLQFCSIHLKTPLHLEILHPLIGFTLFYVSSSLIHRVSRELFKCVVMVVRVRHLWNKTTREVQFYLTCPDKPDSANFQLN